MHIQQLSVFLENTTGRLTEFTGVLKKNNIGIKAMQITESSDFGILRCLVADPEETKKILSENGFNATITNVLAVGAENKSGGLHDILEVLTSNGIAVEYTYSVIESEQGMAVIVIKVAEVTKAAAILSEAGVKMYKTKDLV